MKFDHNFTQTTATPTGRTYAADGWQAQLDFLSGSCLRVALYRDADDLLPTFNMTRTMRPSAPRAERD